MMKMTFVYWILLLVSLPQALGQTQPVSFQCSDLQNFNSTRELSEWNSSIQVVRRDDGSYQVEAEEALGNLQTIAATNIDAYSCISSFVNQNLYQAVRIACSETGDRACTPAIMAPIFEATSEIGEAMLATPHFPLERPQARIIDYDRVSIDAGITRFEEECRYFGAGVGRFILTERSEVLPQLSSQCRRSLFNSIADHLSEIEFPSSCTSQPNHEVCLELSQQLRQAISELRPLVGEAQAEELDAILALCDSNMPAAVERLRALSQQITDAAYCAELPVGESRQVNYNYFNGDRDRMPSLNTAEYQIHRASEDNYELRLNLSFEYEFDEDMEALETLHSIGAPLNPSFMNERAQMCVDDLNERGLLRGPDGEGLSLVIDSDQVQNNTIRLSGPLHRANSIDWSTSVNCGTITHEILHLFGLCDEYEETSRGWVRNGKGNLVLEHDAGPEAEVHQFNCRAVGPSHSIMRDQYQMYAYNGLSLFPWNLNPSKDNPVLGMAVRPRTRPELGPRADSRGRQRTGSGQTQSPPQIGIIPRDATGLGPLRDPEGAGDDLSLDPMDLLLNPESQASAAAENLDFNILLPAHSAAILYPGCMQRNEVYYRCSAAAYESSIDYSGQEQACPELPPECTPDESGAPNMEWLSGGRTQ